MVTVTWYGHAAVGITGDGTDILIDPFLTGNPVAAARPDTVQAHYILVTHGHGDHLGDTIAIAKRTGAQVISNYEIATYCQNQGVNAHPLHIGGGITLPFGKVKLTIAHHGSSLPDGSYGGNPTGVIVTIGGKTIYHAGDTGLFYDMKLIGERHPLDVALLPIGGNFTMDVDDAVYAANLLHPQVVIPMHYDTFDLIKADVQEFRRKVEAIPGIRCVILRPGESYTL